MIKNYFKIAWRNIWRNRSVSLINLFGLSVAMVAFIFIVLWVQNELSFDKYNKGFQNTYLVQTFSVKKAAEKNGITPLPMADLLMKNPGIEAAARVVPWRGIINVKDRLFEQKDAVNIDSSWFSVFQYDIVAGNLNTFNKNPFSLVLTESKAKQFFGKENPVGQVVKVDTVLYQVLAVVKDNPVNSSMRFDVLIPMSARLSNPRTYRNDNGWSNSSYRCFVKLHPAADPALVSQKVSAAYQHESKYAESSAAFQPISKLHFDSTSNDPLFRRGNYTAVYVFTILAVLLVLTACINYINLTIAKASTRTKEISVRKIVGSSRKQLFLQFMCESFLFSFIAIALSMLLLQFALPYFNQFAGSQFRISIVSPIIWKIFLGTLLFVGLLNGVYPAITMAVFSPMAFLKGESILKFKNVLLRKGLVVVQFTVAIVLIIGTVVIFLQMRLARMSGPEYNREQIVSFDIPFSTMRKYDYDAGKVSGLTGTIKNELLKSSSIQEVALSDQSVEDVGNSTGIKGWYFNGIDTSSNVSINRVIVEPGIKDLFNLQLKEGRWHNKDNSDKKNFVLNETAVNVLGIKTPVIGQLFIKNGDDTGRIIGVVKDYNFSPLYKKIEPLVFYDNDELKNSFFVKIVPGKVSNAMLAIEGVWKNFTKKEFFNSSLS